MYPTLIETLGPTGLTWLTGALTFLSVYCGLYVVTAPKPAPSGAARIKGDQKSEGKKGGLLEPQGHLSPFMNEWVAGRIEGDAVEQVVAGLLGVNKALDDEVLKTRTAHLVTHASGDDQNRVADFLRRQPTAVHAPQ